METMKSSFRLTTLLWGLLLAVLSMPTTTNAFPRISFFEQATKIPYKPANHRIGCNRRRQTVLAPPRMIDPTEDDDDDCGSKLPISKQSNLRRNLAQQQSWARDENGNILWWVWLIIGLSCALVVCVCCCSSACCLRD